MVSRWEAWCLLLPSLLSLKRNSGKQVVRFATAALLFFSLHLEKVLAEQLHAEFHLFRRRCAEAAGDAASRAPQLRHAHFPHCWGKQFILLNFTMRSGEDRLHGASVDISRASQERLRRFPGRRRTVSPLNRVHYFRV